MADILTKEELDMFSQWYYGVPFDNLCEERKNALTQTAGKDIRECKGQQYADNNPVL